MTTTVIIIEHLFAGLQASVWILLFILSYFGFTWIHLETIKGFETIFAVSAISIIYPIGIFVDNIADEIFKRWSEKIRDKRLKEENLKEKIEVMKILKDVEDDYLKKYVEYIRVRIRISRFTAFNFALITISSLIFTFFRLRIIQNNYFWRIIIFEFVIGMLITTISLWNWYRISQTFAKQIIRLMKIKT